MMPLFFGCWNTPEIIAAGKARAGHFWFAPGGEWVPSGVVDAMPFNRWIDGGYAPRAFKDGHIMRRPLVADPACCCLIEGATDEMRRSLNYDTVEHPQGAYLVHHKHEWSLMSWWDRTQGDTRGACNSNIVMQGTLEAHELFDLLREHFGHVVVNLANAGVVLRDARGELKL